MFPLSDLLHTGAIYNALYNICLLLFEFVVHLCCYGCGITHYIHLYSCAVFVICRLKMLYMLIKEESSTQVESKSPFGLL